MGQGMEKDPFFHIKSNATYEDVLLNLVAQKIIINPQSFDWVAQKMKYPSLVKPGKYRLQKNWNNRELITHLRSGNQEPVQITFNNLRNFDQLSQLLGDELEPSAEEFELHLKSKKTAQQFGFNEYTFATMFIPNTYEFYWNTGVEDFSMRMAKEFKAFWSDNRLNQAAALNLSQSEVVTVASIVQSETKKTDEQPIVAGLYLNRLRMGMLLQADPTVIFALGDFTIRRVLNVHKNIDSPYNTYKHKGLPPGPILFPEITAIDAVLHAQKHNYIYMCAKEDFSGYHNFSSNYNQHLQYARKYQKALNSKKIFK